jgi:hypothetical protein
MQRYVPTHRMDADMFANMCKDCGNEYIPIPGMDSGHEEHEARGGMVPLPEYAPEDIADED